MPYLDFGAFYDLQFLLFAGKKLHNSFLCDINNETLRRAINKLVSSIKELSATA